MVRDPNLIQSYACWGCFLECWILLCGLSHHHLSVGISHSHLCVCVCNNKLHVEVQEGRSCLLLIHHPVPAIILQSHQMLQFQSRILLQTLLSLLHLHVDSVFVWEHCFTFVNMNSECLVVTAKLYWIAHLPHWHAGELIDLHICLAPVLLLMNCMPAYSCYFYSHLK